MWSRVVAVTKGSLFIASIPIQAFKTDIDRGSDLQHLADKLCSMTLDELEHAGGRHLSCIVST